MASMHAFRFDTFVKRLEWALPLTDGIERDQYDTPEAHYIVVSDAAEQRVTGCARLLPTTKSYMLPDLFPQLLGDTKAPSHPAIWELSRFAASVRETGEGRILSLSDPTLSLLSQILDFARQRGIERLILVTSIGIERLMLRAKIAAYRVAPPALIDGSPHVALYLDVNPPGETG
ncbi:MAG TPA: acyl-homoserine-lactone synthase [Steroidobacteraceae bacterium]|nr:acyl-homoserine-lactone synthase [Steroidobacteraceae bacterium]